MKVLHILSSHIFSGAENVVCQIIKMTKDIPDMQMIYCSPDGTIRPALEERDVQYIPISKMSVREVQKVIREQKPDIVHAHDMKACFISALACGKIPLVCHIHNNAYDSRSINAKSLAFLFAAGKAAHIFWVSKSARDGYCFQKAVSVKSTVLKNIIDIDDLYKRMDEDSKDYCYDVIFIGRLTYPKNPQRFVDVVNILKAKNAGIKCAIVGDGEDRDSLQHTEDIDMLGFVGNPTKILHNARALLMTSDWEGTPMTALEAMALGTPIVSTPVDGMKDLIINGENGYLSNDNTKLAEYADLVINDTELRNRLSQNQKLKAAELNNIENYRSEILNVYEKLV